jgi:thiamine biosynthesis lipoprotein ApbE
VNRAPRAPALALVAFAAVVSPARAGGAVVRATAEVAGADATVEIVETPELAGAPAEALARQAFQEMARADADARALAETVAAHPGHPVHPDEAAFDLLARADAFCRWSENAIGALGGRLFRLWGLDGGATGRPDPDSLAEAIASTRCDALALDRKAQTFTVATESALDLSPFVPGWAVDRAAAVLAAGGAKSFFARLGPVERGVGDGPEGKGWRVEFPKLPGGEAELEPFWLRDHAAAILTADDRPIRVGGDTLSRWLDLRQGRPTENLLAVAAVTELAIDAQGVAWAMSALGPRYGQMSIGQLRPEPAVLWAIGAGQGPPLVLVEHWSTVPKH